MIKPTIKDNKDWMGLVAQKLAEIRLSEVGFRFVPGVFPAWRRVRRFLEAKARIINSN
ncbi:MAG: hypothetical protein PVJ09_02190 [Candidatus Woesebacteria bacterium]|jgi:hypothetical protein